LAKTREIAEMTTVGKLRAVAFGLDGRLLAVGGSDEAAHLWVAADQGMQDRGALPDFSGAPTGVAFGPSGQLAAAGANGGVTVWEVIHSEARKRLELASYTAAGQILAFAPDGKTLACAAGDRSVHLWQLNGPEGRPAGVVRNLPNRVLALALAADGRFVVAGPGFLHLYDGVSAQKLREWWLPGGVNSLLFAADGRLLFLGNDNGAVYALRLDR
jgi:WD40 repeat protein